MPDSHRVSHTLTTFVDPRIRATGFAVFVGPLETVSSGSFRFDFCKEIR